MSDHLPECPLNNIDIQGLCMCPELRACEQRVMETALALWEGQQRYHDGYANGVQAARDAVAGLSPWRQSDPDEVLAAIDALREETK